MIAIRTQTFAILFLVAAALLLTPELPAQKISPEQLDFFESKIRPVLVRECYSCHSEQSGQMKGGLQVDHQARLETGGNSGPAIVPGNLEESLLWKAINYEDFAMPPKAQLPPRVIKDFRQWIDMGAPDPRKSDVQTVPSAVTAEDIRKGKMFWAYRQPTRPPVPDILAKDWARNPIDHFVFAALDSQGLRPSDDANPRSLLRRLSFDLLGLPPAPEQVAEFVQVWNRNPDSAIQQTVNQMLADPGFGERWGRHWLDVARYAESTGRELNATYPNAWRYRDYVIDAFNLDKPYNEFVQEQIAGDLLPARTDEEWAAHLIATGFLALGPKSLPEQNARQFELDLIDEQIDVATRVVLGTSVACARCHDHKFDPIPQEDYYAMVGIFQSTSTHYGTINTAQNRRPSNQLILPIDDPNPFDQSLSRASIDRLQDELSNERAELRELLRERQQARRSNGGEAQARRTFANLTRSRARIAAIESRLDSVDRSGHPRSFCMGVQDKPRPGHARLLVRGEFDQPADVVPRGFVQVLSDRPSRIKGNSSGQA